MIHLITGVWFQERSGLGIAFDHTGAIPVWQTAMCRFMFVGGFGPTLEDPSVLTGNMTDPAGNSELFGVNLTDTELTFVKQYAGRNYCIEYEFRKQPDGTWRGRYSGSGCGSGQARCVLTEVVDNFFTMD